MADRSAVPLLRESLETIPVRCIIKKSLIIVYEDRDDVGIIYLKVMANAMIGSATEPLFSVTCYVHLGIILSYGVLLWLSHGRIKLLSTIPNKL